MRISTISSYALALAIASPVFAESASDQSSNANNSAATAPQDGAGGSAAEEGQELQPGDIVVTALRRSQSLQRTPAAVTVLSGDVLDRQRIVDTRSLQNLTPAARFSATFASTRVFIRGVGSQLDFYWIPETTAVNLNGGYVPRFAISGALYDVDAVQVLPGPQGVLYGRGAGGGVVAITTRKPEFDYAGSFRANLGNYDTAQLELIGNAALSDKVAVRAAVVYNKHDGYQNNGLDEDDSRAVRLSLRFKPSEDFDVTLWGQHFQQKGTPGVGVYLPYIRPGDPSYVPPVDPVTGTSNYAGLYQDVKVMIAGADAQLTVGEVEIRYIGSYLRQEEDALNKLVGNDRVTDNLLRQQTHSLQFSGDGERLDWVAGANLLDSKGRHSVVVGARRAGVVAPSVKNNSLSAFAQLTYSLTDSLRGVGGVRHTRDKLDFVGGSQLCIAACVLTPISFKRSWNNTDWKGGIEYDLAPRVMLYGSIQTGYAPGTLNTFANQLGINQEIVPQHLLAYTAGVKSRTDDGVLTLNIEGYYYDYSKLIVQLFNSARNQNTLFNVPNAKVRGGQVTATLRPTSNDMITANVAYTKATYGSFVTSPGQPNLKGLQMTYTPTWTANLSYERRFDFASAGHVDLRISSYLSSSYWGTFIHSPFTRQKAYSKTDATLTYSDANDRWSVGAYIKNIEDRAVGSSVALSGQPAPYLGSAGLEPPRTYGITVGLKL